MRKNCGKQISMQVATPGDATFKDDVGHTQLCDGNHRLEVWPTKFVYALFARVANAEEEACRNRMGGQALRGHPARQKSLRLCSQVHGLHSTHALAFLSHATSGSLSRAAFSKYIFARSAELERWGRSPRPSPAPTGIDVGVLQHDLQALFFRRALR